MDAARTRLTRAGLSREDAAVDAEVLARNVLGWDRTTYLTRCEGAPPTDFLTGYERMVARRARREPVSLILGLREFWGLEFEVTPEVLTPRPETEILVEEAIDTLRVRTGHPRMADVGTGSGCIAIAVAVEHPRAEVTAVDVSAAALRVARRNAARHGVTDRIDWRLGAYLDGVPGPFDLIVANLPYVADAEMAFLPPEVRDFEPRSALAGGPDGLDALRALIDRASVWLARGGLLMLEIGAGQLAAIRAHVRTDPSRSVARVRSDLRGIPRVVVIATAPECGADG